MKLPNILPPTDLLEQVKGIEDGLRRGQSLSRLGQLGVLLSMLQALVVIVNSDWLQGLKSFKWDEILQQWPLLLALAIFLLSIFLIGWTRFWLKESHEPFRYTYSIAAFEPVEPADEANPWGWLPQWLEYDLTRNLNGRIGRLSYLEEKHLEGEAAKNQTLSHVHVCGDFVLRRNTNDHWIIEVTPRVRIGPPGNPETLSHTVKFDLGKVLQNPLPDVEPQPASAEKIDEKPPKAGGRELLPENTLLGAKRYSQLLERVYFSVASQIYKQIRQDVQHKIDLLPNNRFRAAAYYYEAKDYARSNTLDAYDEARRLYDRAIAIYDPIHEEYSSSGWVSFWQRVGRFWDTQLRLLRRQFTFLLPRLGELEVMTARAEIGYANMLLYRRVLASLSGRRLNPVFEALPLARRAIYRLRSLPENVLDWRDCLFDGYVTLALAWYYLEDVEQARAALDSASQLDPGRVEVDARYQFTEGEVEARIRTELPMFRRAVELGSNFEIAQFQLAYSTEMLWRSRPSLEDSVALTVIDEYERVLEINPGNLGAWANLGTVYWLLADPVQRPDLLERSKEAFQSGREYKEIVSETFVAELDHGLTRLEAEKGEFNEAYLHYTNAISAQIAQGSAHGAATGRYYFAYIGEAIFQRFQKYKDTVEAYWHKYREEQTDRYPSRIVNNVYAFVLNDYGEACYAYYLRNGDNEWIKKARQAFKKAVELNPNYVIPNYNRYQLVGYDEEIEKSYEIVDKAWEYVEREKEYIQTVYALAPKWPDGNFALAGTLANWARQAVNKAPELRDEAKKNRKSAKDDKKEAQKQRVASQQPNLSASDTRKLDAKARELEQSAEKKMRDADEQEQRAGELAAEAPKAMRIAEERLHELLPHKWLWTQNSDSGIKQFDWSVLHRQDFIREHKWQREFDDLHVKTLFTWAKTIRQEDEVSFKEAEKLYDHIRDFFWPNNWDLINEKLDLKMKRKDPSDEEEEDLKRRICSSVKRWRIEESQAFWPVTWLTQSAFSEEEQEDNLEEATDQPGLPAHTYKWIADQWRSRNKQSQLLKASEKAMQTNDARLLVSLAEDLESQALLEVSLKAYRQAQQVDVKDSQNDVAHSQGYYLYHQARILWKLERYPEALSALQDVGDSSPDLGESWRDDFIRALLSDEKLVDTPEKHRLLKEWLVEQRYRCAKAEGKSVLLDIYDANLRLVRERYKQLSRPAQGYLTDIYPALTPIAVEADTQLYPKTENWWQDHPLFKVHLKEMRQRIRDKSGMIVPGVRLRDKETSQPGEYAILIFEVRRASGQVMQDKWYLPNVKGNMPALKQGMVPPDFSWNPLTLAVDGIWINPSDLLDQNAEGLQHWDCHQYMVYHIESLLLENLSELFDIQRMHYLLDEWAEQEMTSDRRKLVEAALPDHQAHTVLFQVMQGLLREQVPLRDLQPILQSFADTYPKQVHPVSLVEAVRSNLRTELPGNDGRYSLMMLSPAFERLLADGLQEVDGKRYPALTATNLNWLRTSVRHVLEWRSDPAALVVRRQGLRPYVHRLIASEFPLVPVLAERELDEGKTLLISEQVELV